MLVNNAAGVAVKNAHPQKTLVDWLSDPAVIVVTVRSSVLILIDQFENSSVVLCVCVSLFFSCRSIKAAALIRFKVGMNSGQSHYLVHRVQGIGYHTVVIPIPITQL